MFPKNNKFIFYGLMISFITKYCVIYYISFMLHVRDVTVLTNENDMLHLSCAIL